MEYNKTELISSVHNGVIIQVKYFKYLGNSIIPKTSKSKTNRIDRMGTF